MTKQFSQEILKFLAQTRNAKIFVELLPDDLFGEDLVCNFVLELLKDYYKDYKNLPRSANLLEVLSIKADRGRIDAKSLRLIEKQVQNAFQPLDVELKHLKERLIAEVQETMATNAIMSNIEKLKQPETIKKVTAEFNQIFRIMERLKQDKLEDPKDNFLFHDLDIDVLTDNTVIYPTYLKTLNNMTNSGGFGSPQLILFAGVSKSFKTGILMNIMLRYVTDLGLKVFYADYENGRNRLKIRALQTLLKAKQSELRGKKFEDPKRAYDWAVKKVLPLSSAAGGDIYFRQYRGMVDTCERISEDLDYLWEEFGWKPDIIAHDYLDLMPPVNKAHKENRFKLQQSYFEFKNLLDERECLGVSLSQLSRAALDVKIIDQSHIAEDIGKIRNADAVFGINQTKKERKIGVARICPIAQREGVPFMGTVDETCFIQIDYDRQQVVEMTPEEVDELLNSSPEEYSDDEPPKKKKRFKDE